MRSLGVAVLSAADAWVIRVANPDHTIIATASVERRGLMPL